MQLQETQYVVLETEEFIEIRENMLLKTIYKEVKEATYIALTMDSNTDCAHIHQFVVVLCYMCLRPIKELLNDYLSFFLECYMQLPA